MSLLHDIPPEIYSAYFDFALSDDTEPPIPSAIVKSPVPPLTPLSKSPLPALSPTTPAPRSPLPPFPSIKKPTEEEICAENPHWDNDSVGRLSSLSIKCLAR